MSDNEDYGNADHDDIIDDNVYENYDEYEPLDNAEGAGDDADNNIKQESDDIDMIHNHDRTQSQLIDTSAVNAHKQYSNISNNNKAVPKDQRMTTSYMTKYERARILGTRALQISLGGK